LIRQLKIKFVCINMLIATVMLAVIFGMVIHTTGLNMEARSIQQIQRLREFHTRKTKDDWDLRTAHFRVVITPAGEWIISDTALAESLGKDAVITITEKARMAEEKIGILQEHDLRYSRSVSPYGEHIIFLDISSERSMMQGLFRTCALIAILSLSVFFVISVLLAQWAVHPVEIAWQQQRQFVADASHELKTPLTVIMTNAELLQDESYDQDERKQFVRSIQGMSHQMRGLVEGLLDLARVDNGVVKQSFAELNLSDLVNDGLLPFEAMFFEQGLRLQAGITEGIRIHGSRPHLQQVLDILLDNAGKYTTAGGTVEVVLRRDGNHTILSVAGPGEAISKDDLKNIFKRFYRIDKARAMNHSYGLGLSIAESIIREHGGKIWAESRGGINTFYIQLSNVLS